MTSHRTTQTGDRGAGQAASEVSAAAGEEAVLRMSKFVCSTDRDMTFLSSQHKHLSINGSYYGFNSVTRSRRDGSFAAVFLAYNASFTAVWVNPTWDGCGFRVESEAPQITWAILATCREMEPLPVNFGDSDDYALKRVFGSAATQGCALGLCRVRAAAAGFVSLTIANCTLLWAALRAFLAESSAEPPDVGFEFTLVWGGQG